MEHEGAFSHEQPASIEELDSLYAGLARTAVLYGEISEISDADVAATTARQFQLEVSVAAYKEQFNVDREVETIKSVELLFQQAHTLDERPVPDSVDIRVESLIALEGLRLIKVKSYELFGDNSPQNNRHSSANVEYAYEDSGYRLDAPTEEELTSDSPLEVGIKKRSESYSAITQEEAEQLKRLLADIKLNYN